MRRRPIRSGFAGRESPPRALRAPGRDAGCARAFSCVIVHWTTTHGRYRRAIVDFDSRFKNHQRKGRGQVAPSFSLVEVAAIKLEMQTHHSKWLTKTAI